MRTQDLSPTSSPLTTQCSPSPLLFLWQSLGRRHSLAFKPSVYKMLGTLVLTTLVPALLSVLSRAPWVVPEYLVSYPAGPFVNSIPISRAALSKNGTTSDYLAVVAFSNTCGDGGPVFLQILSPMDPAAGYVSLTFGNPNCAAGFFTNNEAWAPIAAADGFPHGQFPTPGPTRTTLFGGYRSLNTFCGENMVFALGTAVNRQVLLPAWSESTK
ncbi:hypothetical protein B0H19DRAFT_592101 [Mycena capillaripes]|nr:hypothetical protein B0H19DRAFT_592101 [Mycena capillaripes]